MASELFQSAVAELHALIVEQAEGNSCLRQNIFLGRERHNRLGLLDNRGMERSATALLEQLECQISPCQPVGSLRVGDQQLIEIAKVLSLEAEILIMDEPTSALTETETARLFRIMHRLRERGVTILYISHKMDEVFQLADRITVLRDGQLVKSVDRWEVSARKVTHLMVGREIEETKLGDSRAPGEAVLEVRDLSLPWPGHARGWRLKDINFTLRRGEILGFAGLMGAGRTELLECLFGSALSPPSGQIILDGRRVQFQHPADACRAGIALVTEDRKRLGLFPQMNVGENITICTLRDAAAAGIVSHNREQKMADGSVAELGVKNCRAGVLLLPVLAAAINKSVSSAAGCSRGQRILLLDDPTRGIDVGAKAEIYRLADRLCRDGLGIIVTSSELPELLTLCDRIIVLCEGRITGEFSRAEANEQRIMEAATQREAATS